MIACPLRHRIGAHLLLLPAFLGCTADATTVRPAGPQHVADTARAAGATAATTPAWRFDMQLYSSTVDAEGALVQDPVVEATGTVAGNDGLLQVTRGDGAGVPTGARIITGDAGRSSLVLYPESQRYALLPTMGAATALANAKSIRATVRDLIVTADTLGPCGAIDGHGVTCYRLTRTYRSEVRYFLVRRRVWAQEQLQFWVANDLPGFANPVASYVAESAVSIARDPALSLRLQRADDRLQNGAVLGMTRIDRTFDWDTGVPLREASIVVMSLSRIMPLQVDRRMFDLPASYSRRRR